MSVGETELKCVAHERWHKPINNAELEYWCSEDSTSNGAELQTRIGAQHGSERGATSIGGSEAHLYLCMNKGTEAALICRPVALKKISISHNLKSINKNVKRKKESINIVYIQRTYTDAHSLRQYSDRSFGLHAHTGTWGHLLSHNALVQSLHALN